jgi:hypothetical protein
MGVSSIPTVTIAKSTRTGTLTPPTGESSERPRSGCLSIVTGDGKKKYQGETGLRPGPAPAVRLRGAIPG